MMTSVLIAIIILMGFWLDKQREYIKTIKQISDNKSREIEMADETIRLLIENRKA